MTLSSLVNSDIFLFTVAIIVFLIIVSKLFFNQPLGVVIMGWMGQRPVKWEELDANAHPRMVQEVKIACKMSKDRNQKWLCIRDNTNIHYNSERGIHVLGRIVGSGTYHTHHEVLFRRPWHIRKFIFISPPDLIDSSTSNKNLVYSAISVKDYAVDFIYPTPPKGLKYTERDLDLFMAEIYSFRRTMGSIPMVEQLGETTLLKSGSDSMQARLAIAALRNHMYRVEELPDENKNQSQGII